MRDQLIDQSVDAVVYLAAHFLPEELAGKPRKIAAAVKELCRYLSLIQDETLRSAYISLIVDSSAIELDPEVFDREINKSIEEALKAEKKKADRRFDQIDNERGTMLARLPDDAVEQYYQFRFFERSKGIETGFWFPQQDAADYIRLTNFIIKPLYHLKSPEKNVRLVEAIGFDSRIAANFSNIIELQSSEMLTVQQFATKLFDVGPYLLDSRFTKLHLAKINNRMAFEFRIANEITALGWQPEGFWAFANKAWKDTLKDYDRFGIVEIGSEHFLSPSASEMHKDEKESVYENDKMHSYFPAKVTFKEWSKQIMIVYGDNGYPLLGFAIMTIFLDVVKRYTEAPLWYPYGPKESGKSTLAKSLLALFFSHEFEPFNLGTASTDYAFFNRLERFNNCPAAFNEFDEQAIKDEWFRAFKAVYDGEGRERGRGIRGKTHTQKVKASVVIIGQYLSSKDDNSVLSRTIPCLVKPKTFTQQEVDEYDKLKSMQESGLTSIIVEILALRSWFVDHFKKAFDKVFAQMREVLVKKGVAFSGRILKNYATITACAITLSPKIALPFFDQDILNYAVNKVEEISLTMSESNALSDFWKTVEFLVDRNQIIEGFDYRIQMETAVKIYKDRNTKVSKNFEEPVKVIYIRIGTVFREYARVVSQITKGKGLNEQTLNTYLKEQPYYIGINPSRVFKKIDATGMPVVINTTSLALKYEALGINIERNISEEDGRIDEAFRCVVSGNLVKGSLENMVEFRVQRTIQKKLLGSDLPKNEIEITRCYIANSDQVRADIKDGAILEIKGKTTINQAGARFYRNMDVISYILINPELERQQNNNPIANQDPF